MKRKPKKLFALPDGWVEKLVNAPKVATCGPTHLFIKSLREALGITQTKLSEYLNVDKATISQWERRRGRPQGRSQQRETLDDWAWQISVIQTLPPDQWEPLVLQLRSTFKKWRNNPYDDLSED